MYKENKKLVMALLCVGILFLCGCSAQNETVYEAGLISLSEADDISGTSLSGTAGEGTSSSGDAGEGTSSSGAAGEETSSSGAAGEGISSAGAAGEGTSSSSAAGEETLSSGAADEGTSFSGDAAAGTESVSAAETMNAADAGTAAEETDEEETPGSAKAIPSGYVYVCGAVQAPGVYPLHEGMRVYEAIALAGGFADGADEEWLNQAAALTDGERLYVYTLEETAAQKEALSAQGILWQEENGASGGDGSAGDSYSKAAGQGDAELSSKADGAADDGKVNLNTATRDELMTLSGIGESKADAILNYREEHGAFQSIEEIQNISGIKSGVYEKIKDKITV